MDGRSYRKMAETRWAVVLLTGWLLAGCAGSRHVSTALEPFTVGQEDAVTYVLPKDPGFYEIREGRLVTLHLAPYFVGGRETVGVIGRLLGTMGFEGRLDGILRRDVLLLKWSRTLIDKNGREIPLSDGVECQVHPAVDEVHDAITVRLVPVRCIASRSGDLGFRREDLAGGLAKAVFHYKMEVDSSYKPESIHANFMRLLKHETYREPKKDSVTGILYTTRFSLSLRNLIIPLTVNTYAYRDGSRAVVNVVLEGLWPVSRMIDLRPIIAELRAELTKIVHN